MAEKEYFLGLVQERVANACIGNSTLRNQGFPGLVKVAREFLADLKLIELRDMTSEQFGEWLDRQTDILRSRFPEGAQDNWGAARKAINVFLEEAFYNKFLVEEYGLHRLAEFLELPLDGKVVRKIKEESKNYEKCFSLGQWKGIKNLTAEQSASFQQCAAELATKRGIQRVCLDLWYWRRDDKTGN